jgi:hypothetical protein
VTDREVLAFDLYGTLVDPIAVSSELDQVLGGSDGAEAARLRRLKQPEYTFRLTAMIRNCQANSGLGEHLAQRTSAGEARAFKPSPAAGRHAPPGSTAPPPRSTRSARTPTTPRPPSTACPQRCDSRDMRVTTALPDQAPSTECWARSRSLGSN